MKQPQDHQRSKKKPTRRTVWIIGDSEMAEEVESLEADVRRLQSRAELRRRRTGADEQGEREARKQEDAEIDAATALVEAKRSELRENSVKFVFQTIGRRKYDALIDAHPATEKQIKDAEAQGNKDPMPWNPDSYPDALIAACMVEPENGHDGTDEDRAAIIEWLQGEEWNTAEIMELFQAALAVNQTRKTVDLGKG